MSRAGVPVMVLGLLAGASGFPQEPPDALALYRDGRLEEAITVTLAELAVEPNRTDAFVVMGWSLLALDRFEEALAVAQSGLGVARFDHRIIQIAGEALFGLGRYEEALGRLEEYAALAPEGPRIAQVYALMGEIYVLLQEYEHAGISFTTAVHLIPSRASWWGRLGYARELSGAAAYATIAYQQALKLDPGLSEAAQGLARLAASSTN